MILSNPFGKKTQVKNENGNNLIKKDFWGKIFKQNNNCAEIKDIEIKVFILS